MIFPKKFVQKLRREVKDIREENAELHREILKGILTPGSSIITQIDKEDKEIFDLIQDMYHYGYITDADKREIIRQLKDLHSLLKSTSFSQGSPEIDNLSFLLERIQSMLEHEEEYLDYKPGAKSKEYVKVSDIIKARDHAIVFNKGWLKNNGSNIYFEGKMVQGIKVIHHITGVFVEVTGEHYSSEETIREIYHNRVITPSTNNVFAIGRDPYCYIAESGRLAGKSEKEIRKVLGAKHADSFIVVKIMAPAHSVWIRVKQGDPAKFAIESKNLPIKAPKPQKGFKLSIRNKVYLLAA